MKCKSLILSILGLLSISTVLAQSNSINYKALIKDGMGNVVSNSSIAVQFKILRGVGMTNVYQETHSPNTDANGIVIVNIGEGAVDSGDYTTIDWGSDDHYLNVLVSIGGGLVDMGTTAFNAVPYALNAETLSGQAFKSESGLTGNINLIDDFVFGSPQLDNDGNADHDNRMFFNKSKGAFRAGVGQFDIWDDVNVGDYSVALGFDTYATDEFAFAAGGGSGAFAKFSVALGWGSSALAQASTALGDHTRAEAQGALAFGIYNIGDPDAILEIGNGDVFERDNALVLKTNGNFVVGSPQLDYDGNVNHKLRFFFNKNKGAFRAGDGFSDSWDDVNIGFNSTALGRGTIASGNSSTAFGNSSEASGINATATGHLTIASGTASIASGANSTASGNYASAFGFLSTASGTYSTAMGNRTTATGDNSSAFGQSTISSANSSLAIGEYNIDDSNAYFMIGNGTDINNRDSALVLLNNGDFIVGSSQLNNDGLNEHYSRLFFDKSLSAFRAGFVSDDSWDESNRGFASAAFGWDTNATQTYAFSAGNSTTASGIASTAFGTGTIASGSSATTLGQGTIASSANSTAIGKFNIDTPNSLFIIGNGTNDAVRSTAFSVLDNGNVGIGAAASTFKLSLLDDNPSGYVTLLRNLSSDLNANGLKIRLGNIAPNSNNFYIGFADGTNSTNGKVAGNGAGVTYATTSDGRLKQDISDIENALELINNIQPRRYAFKQIPNVLEYGFIAQELQPHYPQAVTGSPDSDVTTDPMMIDYAKLTPLLTAGIKELHKEINTLQKENEKLKQLLSKYELLEARLSALESKTAKQ